MLGYLHDYNQTRLRLLQSFPVKIFSNLAQLFFIFEFPGLCIQYNQQTAFCSTLHTYHQTMYHSPQSTQIKSLNPPAASFVGYGKRKLSSPKNYKPTDFSAIPSSHDYPRPIYLLSGNKSPSDQNDKILSQIGTIYWRLQQLPRSCLNKHDAFILDDCLRTLKKIIEKTGKKSQARSVLQSARSQILRRNSNQEEEKMALMKKEIATLREIVRNRDAVIHRLKTKVNSNQPLKEIPLNIIQDLKSSATTTKQDFTSSSQKQKVAVSPEEYGLFSPVALHKVGSSNKLTQPAIIKSFSSKLGNTEYILNCNDSEHGEYELSRAKYRPIKRSPLSSTHPKKQDLRDAQKQRVDLCREISRDIYSLLREGAIINVCRMTEESLRKEYSWQVNQLREALQSAKMDVGRSRNQCQKLRERLKSKEVLQKGLKMQSEIYKAESINLQENMLQCWRMIYKDTIFAND